MKKIRLSLIFTLVAVFLIFIFGMVSLLKSSLVDVFNKQKIRGLKITLELMGEKFSQIDPKKVEKSGLRLTLILSNGDVFYDSLKDFSDNLLYKPEIHYGSAVRKDGGKTYLYAAVKVREGYIRLGAEEETHFLSFLTDDFYKYGFLGCAILIFVALFLTESILVPIKEIIVFAKNLKEGRYGARLYVQGTKDMELVSRSLNQMAETIEENHEELKRRQEMIESVILNFPLGIALLDEKGRVEICNPGLEILLNHHLTPHRVYYETFFHSKVIEVLKEVYETKNDVRINIPVVQMDRNAVYELYCHYLDGKVILIIADTTEKEKLNQLKGQFISDITHEFKTPITIILGYLEILEEKLDEKGRYYLNKTKTSLNRLTEIINDLVKLEKIEYAHLFGGLKEIHLKPLTEKAVELLKPLADKKNIQISLSSAKSDIFTQGVEEIIYYSIYNLIENAVKYNDKPEGLIGISLSETESSVIFSICDNGPGISPEYREDVFRRFFRVSRSRTHAHGLGGSGLGLSIVREAVKFHKGSLICKDTPSGQGICFEITLPKK